MRCGARQSVRGVRFSAASVLRILWLLIAGFHYTVRFAMICARDFFLLHLSHIFRTDLPVQGPSCLPIPWKVHSSTARISVLGLSLTPLHCVVVITLFHSLNYILNAFDNKGFVEIYFSLSLHMRNFIVTRVWSHIYLNHSDFSCCRCYLQTVTCKLWASVTRQCSAQTTSATRSWPASFCPHGTMPGREALL